MINLKKDKKGELTTQQIDMLIILIISFGVILFLIFRLNLGETSNKEICHNSIVLISHSKGFVGNVDCKTNYVCISGGGECENFSASAKREVDAENKTQLFEAIAEEMVDCWWMLGEGKLEYESDWGPRINYYCGICAQIKFDPKLQEEVKKITYRELYEYLKDAKKSNSQTYLNYLYGDSDLQHMSDAFVSFKGDLDGGEIFTNLKYYLITGMKSSFLGEGFIFPTLMKSDELSSKDVYSDKGSEHFTNGRCDDIFTKA